MDLKDYALIWDWNGTLLDDLDICIRGINTYLVARNLKPMDPISYRDVFGFPIKDYYSKIGFNFEEESFEYLSEQFIRTYFQNFDQTQLVHKAFETLEHFNTMGLPQYVLSAMDQNHLENSIQSFGLTSFFNKILGANDLLASGKLEKGAALLQEIKLNPKKICLIGDTLHDKEVADQLKTQCILVAGGHQSLKRLNIDGNRIASSLDEVITMVEELFNINSK